MQCVHFQTVDLHYEIFFPGYRILKTNFCNGSTAHISSTTSFLPGEYVNITSSLPYVEMFWYIPQFHEADAVLIAPQIGYVLSTRLDGAITFNFNDLIKTNTSSCITSTATITNIQESMQGWRFSTYQNGRFWATVFIDVVGEL